MSNVDKRKFAIKVENVSKDFKIPHEKHSTLKQAALSSFGNKTFEVFHALSDVNFEVKKGEFFGIVGKNGSGKSTLLKILAGIYVPDTGKVLVEGKLSPFLELGVGFNPELTARENVFLGGALLGLSREEILVKFDSIIKFSELEDFVDMKFKNFSSGMQVRLAFSLAINAHAEILLMDEVLAVGDSNFQMKCLDVFGDYKRQGKTVVLVTHDINVVQKYCDRALLLRNGKMEKIGKAQEIASLYINQNMVDIQNSEDEKEEATTTEEEPKEEKKSKDTFIKKVDFLDGDLKNKKVFKTGEKIIFRIHFETKKEIKSPVFGVAIYTNDGVEIMGPNTRTSDIKIDKISGSGYVDFIIKSNPFYTGSYYFTAALFNWDCTKPYDFRDKEFKFKIQSDNQNQNGIINLDILWKK